MSATSRWPLPVRVAERLFRTISITAILAICLVMCWDVMFRYVLIQPLAWSQEIIQFLMAMMFFAGLPLATLRREHIVVDVISENFTGVWARLANLFAGILTIAYALLLTWYCAGFALKLMGYGDRTDWLGIPWHLAAWAASIAFAASAIASAGHIWRARR